MRRIPPIAAEGTLVTIAGAKRAAREAYYSLREFVWALDELAGDGAELREEDRATLLRAIIAREANAAQHASRQHMERTDRFHAELTTWRCYELQALFIMVHATATIAATQGARWPRDEGLNICDEDAAEVEVYADALSAGVTLLCDFFGDWGVDEWEAQAAAGAEEHIGVLRDIPCVGPTLQARRA